MLRRGPTQWAHLSLWDRKTDVVQPGQWFRGRIYARRCDLSPGGELFVYFAAKHGRADADVGEAWTGLSRPPWLTALSLWENLGSWYGGGAFTADGDLRLDATCTLQVHPDFESPPLDVGHIGADTAPWEARLIAHGWSLEERGFHPRTHLRVGDREVWSKADPHTGTMLFQQVEDWDPNRYGDPYWSTYWLETKEDLIPLDGVEWADWDGTRDAGHPRLVFTRGGRLLEASAEDPQAETPIYDFNPLTPDPAPAPESALRWPESR
ncbi:MAG: hypothetical protein HKO53_06055 [Gemmatimonadetes bacterium]|nr:hypothetical protein [Gemmatimonadota bacterium]